MTFADLTWEDLKEWAGSRVVERGKIPVVHVAAQRPRREKEFQTPLPQLRVADLGRACYPGLSGARV